MTKELAAILDKVHLEIYNVCMGSTPSNWRQSPYYPGIFDAFRQAYPHVCGDAVLEYVGRKLEGEAKVGDKEQILSEVAATWDDWKYAWDQHSSAAH